MTETATDPGTISMYDRIGGAPAVRLAVEQLYTRLLADSTLRHYFDGIDMPQLRRHMALLLSQILGGPAQYDGRELAEGHAGLGITGAAFDRVGEHLVAVLLGLDVPGDIIEAVGGVLGSVKGQIVDPTAGAN